MIRTLAAALVVTAVLAPAAQAKPDNKAEAATAARIDAARNTPPDVTAP